MDAGQHLPWFTHCMFFKSLIYFLSPDDTSQHADNAQQAFSSDNVSTLHLAIPMLEALHRAWSSRADRPKYLPFTPALHAACKKIVDYYEKTTASPAYVMSMSTNFFSYPEQY